jgi:hypothetical protein
MRIATISSGSSERPAQAEMEAGHRETAMAL